MVNPRWLISGIDHPLSGVEHRPQVMNRRRLIVATLAGMAVPAIALASDEKAARKKGGGLSYIQLATIAGSVTHANGSHGVMTVEVGIDVPDATLRNRATQSTPRLVAAFADVVRTYASGLPPGALPDTDYLSTALQRQADAVLGRPGAKLLLGTVLVN
jgi:hypothetical protein